MSDGDETKGSVKNRLYGAAMRRLREANRDQFQGLLVEEYSNAGLEYKRRLTVEEKAEQAKADELNKALVALEAAKAKIAELGGDTQAVEKSVDKGDPFAGSPATQQPFGMVHPANPGSVEASGIPAAPGR